MKKLLKTILMVTILIFALSISALATDIYLAEIDGTPYDTLQNAINNANEGDTVKLLSDYTFGSDEFYEDTKIHIVVPSDKNITLDLNGYTLTSASNIASSVHIIANEGTLKITDSVGTGAIINNNYVVSGSTRYGGFGVRSTGDLIIENAKVKGNNWTYVVYVDGANATFNNAIISGRGAIYACNDANAMINSGTYTIDVVTTNARDNLVYVDSSTLTVNGGKFDGTAKKIGTNSAAGSSHKGSNCIMLVGASTAYVYDGIFEACESDLFVHDAGCTIYAYGGSYNTVNELGNSALHEHNTKCQIYVYGGTFVYNPSDYLAEGYVASLNDNGAYEVKERVYTLNDVFSFIGYSIREDKRGITAGFSLNEDALKAYERQNEITLEFGSLFTIDSISKPAVTTNLTDYERTGTYNLILKDIEEAHYNLALIMVMYVKVGNDTYYVTSSGVVDAVSVTTITYTEISLNKEGQQWKSM